MSRKIFDKWIFWHFFTWGMLGASAAWFFGSMFASGVLPIYWLLVGTGYMSIAWEAVESARGWYEPWQNRLVVDPLVNTAGAVVGWALQSFVLHV